MRQAVAAPADATDLARTEAAAETLDALRQLTAVRRREPDAQQVADLLLGVAVAELGPGVQQRIVGETLDVAGLHRKVDAGPLGDHRMQVDRLELLGRGSGHFRSSPTPTMTGRQGELRSEDRRHCPGPNSIRIIRLMRRGSLHARQRSAPDAWPGKGESCSFRWLSRP